MTTLGLFGGTFDPIHQGHLHIARAFAQQLALDTVIFLPAGDPYHKHPTRTTARHRLAMVELAIADEPRFAVSNIDIVREGSTYTIDTIDIFKQNMPQTQFWWLMGMDSLMQLHTWKNWQKLVRQTHIAVAARDSTALHSAPRALHTWLGNALADGSLKLLAAPEYPVSSSQIRAELGQGKSADAWLPQSVANYIRKQGLYR